MSSRSVRTWRVDLATLVVLAAATLLVYSQVLDTGFWSPEDIHELNGVLHTQSRVTGENLFRPMLSGGYPVNPVFAWEYKLFGMEARSYYVVNLFVHVANSWLAYALLVTLLHNRRSALIAALLFAIGVGSYGKNLMFASGISSLLYAMACLAATWLFVLNEQRNRGRVLGVYALGFFAIFVASQFMRGGTFSILASCIFYSYFFRAERERPVLHTMLVLCLVVAVGTRAVGFFGERQDIVGAVHAGTFLKNLPGYLTLMAFPVQHSELLQSASGFVRVLFDLAPYIRILVGLTFLSFTIFGFVFGNRAVRFYVAWIYVMVVPFAVFRYPADWLNLRFLYLVSLGFCVLLTTAAVYSSKLLAHQRFRRFIPFLVPAAYAGLAVVLVTTLDAKNERLAARLDMEGLLEPPPATER